MKIFFVDGNWSELADSESRMLFRVKSVLVQHEWVKEVLFPEYADVILIQEKASFKNFRYINKLLKDPIISTYMEKVYTINSDDCATGLLRGLYTSLPTRRFNARIHAAVPYMEYPNELVFSTCDDRKAPQYLAGWRGNTQSNSIRRTIVSIFKTKPEFCIETSDNWLNHQLSEKEMYVNLMLDAKFSLCPAGWAPVSFRIYESMALGRCPVILADEFVPPIGPAWNDFALFYQGKRLSGLFNFLQKHENLHESLGNKALLAWDKYFNHKRVENYFAQALLNLVNTAPATTKSLEIKRWKSLDLHWSNNWTVPQRAVCKVRKWSKVIVQNIKK